MTYDTKNKKKKFLSLTFEFFKFKIIQSLYSQSKKFFLIKKLKKFFYAYNIHPLILNNKN